MRTSNGRRRRWLPWLPATAVLAVWAVLATCAMPSVDGHRELTGPEWQHIAADPDAHAGELVVVYGVVTQAGSGTQRDLIHAAVDALDRLDAHYATPAELHGADPGLRAGATFRAEVTVGGSGGGIVVLGVDRMMVLTHGH
jgi:hypothetical protein